MKPCNKYKTILLAASVFVFCASVLAQRTKEAAVSPSDAATQEKKVTICHLTDDYEIHTITVGNSAVNAHLNHGDVVGGCSQENSPLKLSLSKMDVKCNGGNDGAVDLTITFSHGNPPYKIEWSNGATSEDISNLIAGIYSVTVSLSGSLWSTASIEVMNPDPLILSFNTKDVSCAERKDGIIALAPLGGTSPYSYSWSDNAGQQSGSAASNLGKGIYHALVVDANLCESVADIAINEPEPLNISVYSTNESCSGNDGNAIAAMSGGTLPYKYQWDVSANSQTGSIAAGLKEGMYSIVVIDKNECSAGASVKVNKDACGCQLRKEDCGATVVSLGQFIYCNPVQGATNYQWEFSHPGSNFTKAVLRGSSMSNFYLTWVSGIQYGKTYYVRIKPYVNGVWQDYGPVCQITVPGPIPYTKVRVADCGISTTSVNQQMFCDAVSGAQNFQWEFSNAETGFYIVVNRGSSSLSFTLGWVQGLQYGTIYNVRVRANVGGEWGGFGSVCQISLVYPIPTTKVRYADCGKTLTSYSQNIFCDAVAGATDYQWEISDSSLGYMVTMNRNSTNTNFQFGWLPSLQYETTYTVRVRAKVTGEWAEFGIACQITTPRAPSTQRIANFNNQNKGEDEDNDMTAEVTQKFSVYPNPNDGQFNVQISNSGNTRIEIYNMLGEIVYSTGSNTASTLIATNLTSGIYILNVLADGQNFTERIIVK